MKKFENVFINLYRNYVDRFLNTLERLIFFFLSLSLASVITWITNLKEIDFSKPKFMPPEDKISQSIVK